MEPSVHEPKAPFCFGDRSSSDVVVRLRTQEGRDEWLYCHSDILIQNSKYFSDRLSDKWPTCQILDSRNCVEVHCQDTDFDFHVSILRLFYDSIERLADDAWHNVRNALGILRVAVELECPEIVSACVNYLEAVPWEESEEEEILRTIPGMGQQALPILSRLEPVNHSAVTAIFISAVRFATSSPPPSMNDLKSTAQEQLEYMLTEDDDDPLPIPTDEIKSEVRECMKRLLDRFNGLLESLLCEAQESMQLFHSYLSDLSWVCQILTKLEIMRELVISWTEASDKVVKLIQLASESDEIVIKTRLKAIEVASKVLETIGYGSVILPTSKRLHAVQVWLPFVRATRPLIDAFLSNNEDSAELKIDGEMWQSLESTFVSIILALPSGDQAEILNEWLKSSHAQYPDLTEAFEVWCYRSKVAKRRLAVLGDKERTTGAF
ncbi:BTB/POZ domain-containing protein At3g05675 isoform X2 [Punica granatum]|uniref:BTB/POZ domain-containing protein At3g05675 isoform X2 n=1 Tax=Punica granatum TaxID=22663 RepID=A0A6P8E2Z3_PUNGR|nr:BTB/POZ domain-containing protein At3g05675 isoform X2 [Punica granatum]XP_031399264.1 BTB/POZ domain-containing protein At3g05675 isoform X2 [Punica granatum]